MIGKETSVDKEGLFRYRIGYLADNRSEYIELWAKQMMKHPVIGKANLTSRQRRHIASIMWYREVAKSNDHMGVRQQPPPVVGLDSRGRPVIQQYRDGHLSQYALTKEGDPYDIYEPVISLKTGERVRIIDRTNIKESRY